MLSNPFNPFPATKFLYCH